MTSKSNWNVYCTRFLVRARQLTEPIAFTDPFGHEHIGRPGDYLVETCNGIRRIAAQTFFEDTYMPLAAKGPGTGNGDLHERRPPGAMSGAARQSGIEDRRQATA